MKNKNITRGSISNLISKVDAEKRLKLINIRIKQAETVMKTMKEELEQLNAERRIYDNIINYHNGIFVGEK